MSHYYTETQESKIKLRKFELKLRNKKIKFYTSSGVFSSKKLDYGSELLIKNMIIDENDVVLDLGCGYGVIGIVAATLTKNKVFLIDINKRACDISKMNCKLNDITNIVVKQGNLFNSLKNLKFDKILINPPQTAGKKICFEIIEKSKNYLKKKGLLELVARHNKGGKTLSEKMQEVFKNMKTIAIKGGYRVYISKNG